MSGTLGDTPELVLANRLTGSRCTGAERGGVLTVIAKRLLDHAKLRAGW